MKLGQKILKFINKLVSGYLWVQGGYLWIQGGYLSDLGGYMDRRANQVGG